MADWADEKADHLMGAYLDDFNVLKVESAIAQALREAEARGMERAAKIAGEVKCAAINPDWDNCTRCTVQAIRAAAGTERQAKESGK